MVLAGFCAITISLLTIQYLYLTGKLPSISLGSFENNDGSFIYAPPEAEDKVVVMAKMGDDNVDWAYEQLPESVIPQNNVRSSN